MTTGAHCAGLASPAQYGRSTTLWSETASQVLRLRMLGGLSVSRDGRAVSGALAQPRRLAVLALLARAGPAGMPRDKIVATLWPDLTDERARHTLAQTLYAIRRETGNDDIIEGIRELRLNTDILSVDVADFQAALATHELQRAADVYAGPLLDGFHIPGADEFERWVDRERAALDRTYTNLLEQLAREASDRAEHDRAVHWWRSRAAHDPLEARVALALMQALVASGDRLAAIQHARVYELLVEEELSLPPDRDVVRYASELRREQAAEAARPEVAVAVAPPVDLTPVDAPPADFPSDSPVAELPPAASLTTDTPRVDAPPAEEARDAFWFPSAEQKLGPLAWRSTTELPAPLRRDRPPTHRHRTVALAAAAGIIAIAALGALAVRRARLTPDPSTRTIAVGRITDYRRNESAAIASSVTDLLATNLGRANGIRVVSTARMYDLLRRVSTTGDSSSGTFAVAAQQAGADELVDGALYEHDGRLRLDLRRIDLTSGAVRAAYSVEAPDVFSLADSGTVRLVSGLGIAALPGSVADVTTRSAAAYRMYEQGLRAHFRGDIPVARNFFEAAVAEDSLFALAQYYAAVDAGNIIMERQRLERAKQLASRASERERLTITAGWANTMALPSLRAIAETLATRYPAEVAGHLYVGIALVEEGRHLEALAPLARVIAMDSLGLHRVTAGCGACDAFQWTVGAYQLADSLPAAERVARRWLRLQPDSRLAIEVLIQTLDAEGRGEAADSMLRAVSPRLIEQKDALNRRAAYLIRAGNYSAAEQVLADVVASGGDHDRIDAYWMLAIALRQQGRFAAALDTARRMRAMSSTVRSAAPGTAPGIASLEGQILLERGQPREAAFLFDSIAHGREDVESGSTAARRETWNLAHSASARAAAGDTAGVERLIDSVRSLGAASGYGRDVQMHHFVRGLLFAARHDDQRAVQEFQQSIVSRNFGHTRANYELGRALMRLGRPADAIAAVQPALRGSLEASNLYVSRTELHELLAQAWEAANGRDSAVVHYRLVSDWWRRADPVLQPRRARAEERLGALSARR